MFVVDALWEAAMSCVATAQACREATSSFRMARFFKADDAVAFVMLRRSSAATFKAPCAAGSLGFFAAPYRQSDSGGEASAVYIHTHSKVALRHGKRQ